MWTFDALSPHDLGLSIPRLPSDELVPGEVQGSLDFVRDHATAYERRALDSMASIRFTDHRLHTHVKLRCVDLIAGQTTCGVPGWHIDCVATPDGPGRPEAHVLMVAGGYPTEFLARPLLMVPGDAGWMRGLLATHPPDSVAAPLSRLVWYGRMHLHRGSVAAAPTRRLLIRMTRTDVMDLPNRSNR